MAKTKTEKITSIEEEIRQLENKRRQLVQEQKAQERRDRTKRLCRRMGLPSPRHDTAHRGTIQDLP